MIKNEYDFCLALVENITNETNFQRISSLICFFQPKDIVLIIQKVVSLLKKNELFIFNN